MADSESLLEAGKRLACDLRAIRRSRAIDVKEVLDATRLAEDVIEQLEETALMGNPMFNRVYLRSMFSSYASVLGIQNSEMMAALEEALSGQYIGSLAKTYLGESRGEDHDIHGPDETEPDSSDEEPLDAPDSQVADSALKDSAPDLESEESSSDSELEGHKSLKGQESEIIDSKGENKKGSEKSAHKKVVAAAESLYGDSTSTGKTPARTVLLPNMSGFLILVVAGIALISLIWFAVSWLLTPQTDPDDSIASTDSSQVVNRILPERIVLGDTIRVDLIAYFEALDPIRVKADRDLRRPYWIEHNERRVFEMIETIEFEREVDHARILIDGYLIPVSWYASSVRAEVTREKTQAWLDSLTSAGTFPPRPIETE